MLSILQSYWPLLLSGFWITIQSSLLALILSLTVGILIATLQLTPVPILRLLSKIYVEFFRNVPLLVILFFIYFVLPHLNLRVNGFTAGTISLTLYTSAYIAETIRSGIQSVPSGQMEAARASGLNYIQSMGYVVLPQAIKITVPPLGNQFINLVKNSSVLSVVGGFDLMYQGDVINSATYNVFGTYILVALFYLILTLPLSYGMVYLEKRWRVMER